MADDQDVHKESDDVVTQDHDPYFPPIITLPETTVSTLEEDEVEMIKLRAKLFRYDKTESPPEWKERGTGDVKLLKHTKKDSVRVVMRRDKTLKLCANHNVSPWMDLKPSSGSDRAWVYSVDADYADGELKQELLAIKFANADNAKKWKDKFEEAKNIVESRLNKSKEDASTDNDSGNSDDESSEKNKTEDCLSDTERSCNDASEKTESVKCVNFDDENVREQLEKLKVEQTKDE